MIRFYPPPRKSCSSMFKRVSLLSYSMLLLLFCMIAQTGVAQEEAEINGIPGYLGMPSLKGNWRPFNNSSPWNTEIPAGVGTHTESRAIIDDMKGRNYPNGITIRFAEDWNPTLHVVNSRASKYRYKSSTNIYRFTHFNLQNFWNPDVNGDDITDETWPFIPGVTYPENMADGRMIIVDKSASAKYTAYEVSHGGAYLVGGYAPCSTFNIWGLGSRGIVRDRPVCTGNLQWPDCDDYWPCAGGHGAGTSLIAGLIRPNELLNALDAPLAPTDPNYNPDVPSGDGVIHHALKFSYNFNRCGPPLYPFAYRNDGPMPISDTTKPVEGMLFQLVDTNNSIENSISNPYGKVVVRTLKKYGMVLVDNGSNDYTMALYIQNMYTPGGETNKQWWNRKYPGLYDSITGIKAENFQVVDTGDIYGARLLMDHSECPP